MLAFCFLPQANLRLGAAQLGNKPGTAGLCCLWGTLGQWMNRACESMSLLSLRHSEQFSGGLPNQVPIFHSCQFDIELLYLSFLLPMCHSPVPSLLLPGLTCQTNILHPYLLHQIYCPKTVTTLNIQSVSQISLLCIDFFCSYFEVNVLLVCKSSTYSVPTIYSTLRKVM